MRRRARDEGDDAHFWTQGINFSSSMSAMSVLFGAGVGQDELARWSKRERREGGDARQHHELLAEVLVLRSAYEIVSTGRRRRKRTRERTRNWRGPSHFFSSHLNLVSYDDERRQSVLCDLARRAQEQLTIL